MKTIVISVFLLFLFAGCNNSSNPSNAIFNPSSSTKPIFPMPGYNARNTSNPYCINAYMNPVQYGVADWSYTFQGNDFSDGSEFCVDSKSNIYYISQPYNIGGFYKFSQNGEVIWKIDSLIEWNYAGISLSADESRVYFVAFKNNSPDSLYCIDSTGKKIWSLKNYTVSKPVIGKDGDLYTFFDDILTAITKDGVVKWQNAAIKGMNAKFKMAIDREDNIYVANETASFLKVDKNGVIIWQYNTGFYINGVTIDGFGNIYFNGAQNKLYCLSPEGNLKWIKQNINQYSSPVITSDNKILISLGINIIAFDTSGTQVWKSDTISNSIAENIILDDYDNAYYLLDITSGITVGSISSTGKKRWEFKSSLSTTLPAPVLLPSGKMLFAPKRAWKIQAIR